MNGTDNFDDLPLLEPEEIIEKINTCRREKVLYYKSLLRNCSVFKENLQDIDSSNSNVSIIDEHTKRTEPTSETSKSRKVANVSQQLDSHHKLYLDSTEAMPRAPADNANSTYRRKVMKSKNKTLEAPTLVSIECRKKHFKHKAKKSQNKDTEVPAETNNNTCQPEAIKSPNKRAKLKIRKSTLKSIRKLIHNLSNYKMLKTRFENEYNQTHKSSNNTSCSSMYDKKKADSRETNEQLHNGVDTIATVDVNNYYEPHNEQKTEVEKKIEISEANDLDEMPCCSKSVRKTTNTAPPYTTPPYTTPSNTTPLNTTPPYTTPPYTTPPNTTLPNTSPPNNMEANVKSNNQRNIKRDVLVEKIDKILKPYQTDPQDERISPEFEKANIKRYNDDCKFLHNFYKYCCPKESHHNVSRTAPNHSKIEYCNNVRKRSSSILPRSVKELINMFESKDQFKKNQVPRPSNNYPKTRNSLHMLNSSTEPSQSSETNQTTHLNILGEIISAVPTHSPTLLKDEQKHIDRSKLQHNLSSNNRIIMGKVNSTSKSSENECIRRKKGGKDMPTNKMPKLVFSKELRNEEDVNSLCEAPYCDQSQGLQNTMTVYMCNCDIQGNTTNQINESGDISQEKMEFSQSPSNIMLNPLHSIECVKSAEEEHLLLLQEDLQGSCNYANTKETNLQNNHEISETQCLEKCYSRKVHSSANNSETYLNDLKEEFAFCMPSNNENLNENTSCIPKKQSENISTSQATKKHFRQRRPVFLPPSSSHSARTPSSSSHFLGSELSCYRFPRRVHYSSSSLPTMSSSLAFSTCTSISSLYANSHTTSSTSASSHSIATLEENDNNLIVSPYPLPNDELEKSNPTFEAPTPGNFILTTEISFNPLGIYLPQHFLGGVIYFYPRIKSLIKTK